MEGNNKIIERILADARARCDELAAQAEEKSKSLIAANEVRLAAQRKEIEQDCESRCKQMHANILANTDLDLKKYRLSLKRELVDQAYQGAYKELTASQEKYLALIGRLLKTYAEKGETVDIAKKDSKVITAQFLDKLGLGLKLGGDCDIDGGVVLHGKGYEKDISLEAVFRSVRERTEIEVANALFGRQ